MLCQGAKSCHETKTFRRRLLRDEKRRAHSDDVNSDVLRANESSFVLEAVKLFQGGLVFGERDVSKLADLLVFVVRQEFFVFTTLCQPGSITLVRLTLLGVGRPEHPVLALVQRVLARVLVLLPESLVSAFLPQGWSSRERLACW